MKLLCELWSKSLQLRKETIDVARKRKKSVKIFPMLIKVSSKHGMFRLETLVYATVSASMFCLFFKRGFLDSALPASFLGQI